MTDSVPLRYSIVDCVVVGHQPYGLIVQSGTGVRGFIDRMDISDIPAAEDEWPALGTQVHGVVLGHARDGRLRLSARRMDKELLETLADPVRVLREWEAVKQASSSDVTITEGLYKSSDGRAVLRWALKHPSHSAEHMAALDILATAPMDILRDVLGNPPTEHSR